MYPPSHPPQRRPSLLGTDRPITLTFRRSSSGEDDRRTYLRSRNSATRLSQCLDRQCSLSLDQLLYDNSKSHHGVLLHTYIVLECEQLLECRYIWIKWQDSQSSTPQLNEKWSATGGTWTRNILCSIYWWMLYKLSYMYLQLNHTTIIQSNTTQSKVQT